jgi:hypothetical protein
VEDKELTYYRLIADYLDNRMNEDEEIAFMEQLSLNEDLRMLYEQHLDMNWKLEGAKQEDTGEQQEKIISIAPNKVNNYWWLRIAAIVIVMAGVGIIFLQNNKTKKSDVGSNIVKIDTSVKATDTQPIFNPYDSGKSPNLFERYYAKYAGTDEDPVAISLYLSFYKNGEYQKVLKASKDDYQLLGNVEEDVTEYYMELYKALSQLEINNPASAGELQKISEITSSTAIKDHARWYAALAFLKHNNPDECKLMLQKIIANKNSRYQAKAEKLLSDLSGEQK